MEHYIAREIELNNQSSFTLGSYLYMGMALKKNKKVCISVAYRIDYCIKKIDEFMSLDDDIVFIHISKIKTGELKAIDKFNITKPYTKYYL